MTYRIVLSSDEYGHEDFNYDSLDELRTGMDQLLLSCDAASQVDGIDRTITAELWDYEEK